MRKYVFVAALLLAGCAGGGERTSSATATVPDGDYGTIFRNITSAAVSAGFIIRSAHPDTGQIAATGDADSMLNNGEANVSILVTRAGTGVQIAVSTAVQRNMGGRILDAGDPRESMRKFCSALQVVISTSTCAVQSDHPAKAH